MQWRAYADGVVVYVAETCETHLLPAGCRELLEASIAGLVRQHAVGAEAADVFEAGDRETILEGAALRELLDLKILEPAN